MFYEVFTHEYFWLSFLPISFLGVGFWLLLFKTQNTLEDHWARPIILEGFLVAFIIHLLFNLAMDQAYPAFAFFIALFFVWFLRHKMEVVGGQET